MSNTLIKVIAFAVLFLVAPPIVFSLIALTYLLLRAKAEEDKCYL